MVLQLLLGVFSIFTEIYQINHIEKSTGVRTTSSSIRNRSVGTLQCLFLRYQRSGKAYGNTNENLNDLGIWYPVYIGSKPLKMSVAGLSSNAIVALTRHKAFKCVLFPIGMI